MTHRLAQGGGAPPDRRRQFPVVSLLLGLLVLFVVLASPIGDRLQERAVPAAVIAAVLVLPIVLSMAAVVFVLIRRDRRARETGRAQHRRSLEEWAGSAGWSEVGTGGPMPAVLDQVAVRSARPLAAFAGLAGGLPVRVTLWTREFRNRGSAIGAQIDSITVVIADVPRGAWFAMGKVGPDGVQLDPVRARVPHRWMRIPPRSLAPLPSQAPWGPDRVRVWAGVGVPPVPAWGPIAEELDALGGWLLIADGALELNVLPDPARGVMLAVQALRLLGTGSPQPDPARP